MPNYRLKIDVTKLDKSAFFKGAKGTYVDITLWENEEADEYGNTHSAKQDLGKERRGEKTPYIGNMKPFGSAPARGRDVPASEARMKMHGGEKRTTRDNSAVEPDFDEESDIPFSPKPAPFQP